MKENITRKALVLEDDIDAIELISGILITLGFETILTTNLKEAKDQLQTENEFDLLFFDYNLPDGNSFELLMNKDLVNDTPTILCSAYLSSKDISQAYDLGVTKCLKKPISFVSVVDTVNNHIFKQ